MITDLPTKSNLNAFVVTNISRSFTVTHKMATKINWHRHGGIITSLSRYVLSEISRQRVVEDTQAYKARYSLRLAVIEMHLHCTGSPYSITEPIGFRR